MFWRSKTFQESPWRPKRAPKMLSWETWGHLEPSWSHLENKSFWKSSGFLGLLCGLAILANFGAHFGAQNWLKIHFFGGRFFDFFLDHFWTIWGAILGTVWGPDRPKRSQNGTKRTIKSPKVLKTYFCKNLKKHMVSRFLGSRGILKEP